MPRVLWFLHIPQQYRVHYWLYRNVMSGSRNYACASSEGLAHLLGESYSPSPCCPGKSTWKRSYNLWEQYKILGSSKLSRNKTLTNLRGKATFKSQHNVHKSLLDGMWGEGHGSVAELLSSTQEALSSIPEVQKEGWGMTGASLSPFKQAHGILWESLELWPALASWCALVAADALLRTRVAGRASKSVGGSESSGHPEQWQ